MKKIYKKIIAGLMCVIYIASAVQITSGAASIGKILHESSLKIANNATYTKIIASHNTHGRQEANVFEFDPSLPGVEGIASYSSKLYGRSDIYASVDYAQNTNGLSIAGGINGDFYSFQTGIPMGVVIRDAKLVSSDSGFPAIGFTYDGRGIIGKPQISITLTSGDKTVSIPHFNKYRTPFGVYMLSEDFSAESRTTTLGTHIVLEIADGQPKLGTPMEVYVSDIMTDAGNIALPENSLVLTVDGAGPLDQVDDFQVGQIWELYFDAADDDWNNVTEAIGGGQLLVEGGAIVPDSTAEVAPRTAVGIKADGSVVMAQIDGRNSGHSKGSTISETAEFMQSLGCVTALNLDGGGSSTTYLREPGMPLGAVVNVASDGAVRKNANFILLANTQPSDAQIYHLQFYPYNIEALYNADVPLDIKATDASYHTVSAPTADSLIFDVSEGLGSVYLDGYTARYKAGKTPGEGIIFASLGAASGSTSITVLSSIDELYVYRKDSTSEVKSLDLMPGDKVEFDTSAYKNGVPVYSQNESFTWELSDSSIGEIDESGRFTASEGAKRSGTITVSYGNVTKTVSVDVGRTVDLDPPVIKIDSMEGWNQQNEYLYVGALITDDGGILPAENITLEIDGVSVPFGYDQSGGILTARILNEFSAGLHKISITAVDESGNRASKYDSITIESPDTGKVFEDMKGHWAVSFAEYLYNTQLVKGVVDDSTGLRFYNPDYNITRAEFAVMLSRYLKLDVSQSADDVLNFTDADKIPAWALPDIRAISANGAMTGKPDGYGGIKFDPSESLTRAEIITAIGRLIPDGYKKASITFADASDIGDWAKPYVGLLVELNVISGYYDGTLQPAKSVTRAEVSKILYSVY